MKPLIALTTGAALGLLLIATYRAAMDLLNSFGCDLSEDE